MSRTIAIVLAAILMFMLAGSVKVSGAPTETSQTTVFVTLPMTDGFTDATHALLEAEDAVRTALSGIAEIRMVNSADEADVVLTVLGRGRGDVELTAALHALPDDVGASPVPIATNERYIEVKVAVGSYQRAFVGTGIGERDRPRPSAIKGAAPVKGPASNSWEACAAAVAKDLRAWLSDNATRIRARR